MSLVVIRNDITKVKADAIVNTANPRPCYGNGTDRAIYMAAGAEQLLADRKIIGNIDEGDVAVTKAYNLPAKFIIHAVTPVWWDGEHGELDMLRSAYEKAFAEAVSRKCKSIAFPVMASGSNGYPNDVAIKVAFSELTGLAMDHPNMKVYLVVFGDAPTKLAAGIQGKIKEVIDSATVEAAQAKEYIYTGDYEEMRALRISHSRYYQKMAEQDESILPPISSGIVMPENKISDVKTGGIFKSTSKEKMIGKISIDALKNQVKEQKTFASRLIELIDARGLKDSKVYDVCMSRQSFQEIRDGKYLPSKSNLFVFILNLKLNLEDAEDLLNRAGYSFNQADLFDCAIRACIEKKMYDVHDVIKVLEFLNLDAKLIKKTK